ncbi:unnamed protein product [Leptidea sinapis]|uniref:Uncharacterized protein n=1 Tax=Leptidea sinapis TaxID=189913 RepID=A0A5E4Q970_9NEOP|nr:unnamed protein product [Leptidea sinapis]
MPFKIACHTMWWRGVDEALSSRVWFITPGHFSFVDDVPSSTQELIPDYEPPGAREEARPAHGHGTKRCNKLNKQHYNVRITPHNNLLQDDDNPKDEDENDRSDEDDGEYYDY